MFIPTVIKKIILNYIKEMLDYEEDLRALEYYSTFVYIY